MTEWNLPPGYNGSDGPNTAVVVRCSNGHYTETTMTHEYGGHFLEIDDCPRCGADVETTDLDYAPEDDEPEEDEE